MAVTGVAAGSDDANSWLPFTGKGSLRRAVAAQVERRSGVAYDPESEVTITCGEAMPCSTPSCAPPIREMGSS